VTQALNLPKGPLVDSAWLSDHLGDPGIRIVDATWTWAASSARPDQGFASERIPGAVYFDHAKVADPNSALTDTRPDLEHFRQHVGALGIDEEATVVVYSQKGTAGGASRAWWLFRSFGHERVFVLDGGLVQWKESGGAVESGAALPPAQCRYVSAARPELVTTMESLRRAQEEGGVQILDARPARFFAGEGVFDSGNPAAASLEFGRIPGSLNFPSASVVDGETRQMKSADELAAMLEELGVDLERPVVTTCSLGIGACTAALALATVGAPIPSVFDGAWQEWGGDATTPKTRDKE
jgi:thiosulfate/3-mercaptopyruvate sulfurtransferase